MEGSAISLAIYFENSNIYLARYYGKTFVAICLNKYNYKRWMIIIKDNWEVLLCQIKIQKK